MGTKFEYREGETHAPIIDLTTDPHDVRTIFASGAVRQAKKERFDLICPVGLRRLALTYAEGAAKYSDNNWCKGIPVANFIDHALRHINQYQAGETGEDHLAHAIWNLWAIMHFEEDCKHHEVMENRSALHHGTIALVDRGDKK